MPSGWWVFPWTHCARRCSSACAAPIAAPISTTPCGPWPRCRCWRPRWPRHDRTHSGTPEGKAVMTLRDKTAVVGIGATPYYRRGESLPQTELELACKAILAALADAGLTIKDLDGFTIYSSSCDPAL